MGYIIAIPSGESIADHYTNTNTTLRDTHVGTACEKPGVPQLPSDGANAFLEYYLKYEKYKIDWKNFIDNCSDQTTFQNAWNAYDGTSDDADVTSDGAARNFKIPPLAIYVDSNTTFTMENVAPGSYDLYYAPKNNATASTYGKLFSGTTSPFSAGPVSVTVTSGSTETAAF